MVPVAQKNLPVWGTIYGIHNKGPWNVRSFRLQIEFGFQGVGGLIRVWGFAGSL